MKMQIFPISTQMGTTNLVVEARLCSERKTHDAGFAQRHS